MKLNVEICRLGYTRAHGIHGQDQQAVTIAFCSQRREWASSTDGNNDILQSQETMDKSNRQRQQHHADQGGNGQVQQTGKTVVQGKNGQVQQTVTTAFYRSRREWTGQFNRQWQQHPTDQGENGQVSSTDSNNSILRSRKRMNRFNRQ